MICNKNMASKGGVKMKFNFKIQQYQTDAVVKIFNGQGFYDKTNFQSVQVRNTKKGAVIK